MNAELTLSLDPRVIADAKRYAADAGTSVSELVENFLAAIATSAPPSAQAPVLSKLRGCMKNADVASYHAHLERKYD
ncbi:MAG: hypothetical protein HYV07_24885 [Deltaproteobacteria bacterium]|nr:hypothetical protein [Deltaproteobacteria bacterium]